MPTNILSLPLAALVIETGNNEDWIESLLFVVDDGSGGDPTAMPQLDLRGISFELEVRRRAEDHEVVIHASTDNGMLQVGSYPNYGFLIIDVDDTFMQPQAAGDYVGDVVATDAAYTRRVMTFDLNIVEGVTR